MTDERQTNYTIAEGYELPSKGLIYDGRMNSHIELRSMTARDEMKRLNPSTTQFKTLADIIEGCMIEKPTVHVYDLALADYEYLLHKLRIVTYGDEYKMTLKCPFCGEIFDTSAHLEDLHVKEIDIAEFEALRTITLPKSGKTVKLKFQTPRMLDDIDVKTKEMKRKYKEASLNLELLVRLSASIDTVDDEKLDPIKMETFINNLPAADMVKIINSLDKLNSCFGIENDLELTCTSCGGDVKTYFRFGAEFFRPSNL